MFNYFYIKPEEQSVFGIKTARVPVAKNTTPVVDVYKDLKWCLAGDKSEVPQIKLIEKQIDFGSWVQNAFKLIDMGGKLLKNELTDPYEALYVASDTGFVYNLPYLLNPGGSLRGGVSNSWGAASNILDNIPGISTVKTLASMALPGVGTEPVKSFSNTEERTITISFPLYNTIDIKSANDHFSFVSLLTFQNLKTRTSFMTYMPPKIYEVTSDSEGGVYMPVAYISNLKIDSIGTTRSLTDYGAAMNGANSSGKRLVPEAYKVTITLQEMMPQSANIVAGEFGDERIKAVVTGSEAFRQTLEGGKNLVDTISNLPQRFSGSPNKQNP